LDFMPTIKLSRRSTQISIRWIMTMRHYFCVEFLIKYWNFEVF